MYRALALLWLSMLFRSATLFAQLTTGIVEGVLYDGSGRPQAGVTVMATGNPSSFRRSVKSNQRGEFEFVLPHGDYEIYANAAAEGNRTSVHVLALQVSHISIGPVQSGQSIKFPSDWNGRALQPGRFAESYSVSGAVLSEEPAGITQPLDFTGLQNARIPLLSERAFSWTGTRYSFEGMNATDSYQPGYPVVFPDVQAIDEITIRSAAGSVTPNLFAAETGAFVRVGGEAWHCTLESSNSGGALASNNLPDPANRGALEQPDHYHWFTRDRIEVGGPLSSRADVYLSGTGQWASQTVPIAPRGQDQNSRLLLGNANSRIRVTSKDQIDLLYTGSRINLSDWGQPAGLEALIGWRMMPMYESMYGFSGLAEADDFNSLQTGWTRQLWEGSRGGVLQVRYNASIAHLDTNPTASNSGAQSRTDLLGNAVTGPAPLSNFAIRQRQAVEAAFQPGDFQLGSETHRITLGGGWDRSNSENRFNSPSDLNVITAAGAPAFVVELNTPVNPRERVQSFSSYIRDQLRLARWFWLDLGVSMDFSRGWLPDRSPERSDGSGFPPDPHAALIAWNTASPHAGIAIAPPGFDRLILHGTYSRTYAPLAGQYLDFANPNSLSGLVFQWRDLNNDGIFQRNELGTLLRRFGGAYSAISPALHRPYADQFDVGAAASFPRQTSARIQLFRRDEKDRIAAINTGVPPQAFQPVTILDPGPDGIPGTFDDRQLVVYQQNPASLGTDAFLLTNPPGLRMLYEGFIAELATRHKYLDFHASFMREKSFGPTNPGNGVLENDSGVIGALYQDPNTLINATGHDFFDRSAIGKIEMVSHLPAKFGGIEVSSVAGYLDGLPFARELLVTGLAQGPFLVAATLRGSPEGGNRSEYVFNWNLRLARTCKMTRGELRLSTDLLNVLNFGNRIQENDITGVNFNSRLPVAIQTPRFARFTVGYSF